MAIPLSLVARLEEFPRTVVEHAGTQEVMQYRGQIIPLVRLSAIIPATSDAEMLANAGSIQVVVYSEGKRTVGLIVDRIVDIVEEHAAVESLTPRAGVMGSFVTQRHVTDLLDLPAIVRAAVPGLLDASETGGSRTVRSDPWRRNNFARFCWTDIYSECRCPRCRKSSAFNP